MNLPEWMPIDAWNGFVEMRKKMKKPMTDRAAQMKISDLHMFKEQGHDIEAILNQSTANNYLDLYELKDKSSAGQKQKIPQLGKAGNVTAAAAQEWLSDGPMDDTLEMRKRFASLITGLSDYYKSEISKAMLGIYWQGLKQFSYEAIEKACWAHTQLPDEAGRWMPRNSDIIKMMEGSTVDQGALAWSRVDNAIRTRGTWDDVVFDDAVIHRVVADMGGWVLLGSKDDKEWPFVAKEFQQRYRSFKQQGSIPEHPERLIGMANAHNKANGQPLLPPILIGDKEKAKAVLLGMAATNRVALSI